MTTPDDARPFLDEVAAHLCETHADDLAACQTLDDVRAILTPDAIKEAMQERLARQQDLWMLMATDGACIVSSNVHQHQQDAVHELKHKFAESVYHAARAKPA